MPKMSILLLIGITFTAVGQSTLGSDLKACYSLNGNANDPISGLNGAVGAVTPATNRNNVPNTCYDFAGNINSIITLPDDSRLKGKVMTVSAWVYPTSGAGSYVIFAKNNFSSYHEAYCIGIDYYNSVFSGAKVNSIGIYYAKWNNPIILNTWYHLVITVDTTSIALYANGVLRASISAPGPIEYESGKSVQIGGSAETYFPAPFSGKIDNVRFYNRILTATEISQLYQADPACIQGDGVSDFAAFLDHSQVMAYPNPASEVVYFDNVPAGTTLKLFDMLGTKIIEQILKVGTSEINISYLRPGAYYGELWQGTNRINIKLLKE